MTPRCQFSSSNTTPKTKLIAILNQLLTLPGDSFIGLKPFVFATISNILHNPQLSMNWDMQQRFLLNQRELDDGWKMKVHNNNIHATTTYILDQKAFFVAAEGIPMVSSANPESFMANRYVSSHPLSWTKSSSTDSIHSAAYPRIRASTPLAFRVKLHKHYNLSLDTKLGESILVSNHLYF